MAADRATITIHKAESPAGVGDQIFEKCHSNGLGGGNFATGPDGGESIYTTDADDVIGPVTIAAGHVNITEDPAAAVQHLGQCVYCRDLTTDTVLFDSNLSGNGVHGSTPAGANVFCDWYDITPADNGGATGGTRGGTTNDATTTTAGTTTTLPATGVGMPSYDGSPIVSATALLALVTLAGAYGLRRRSSSHCMHTNAASASRPELRQVFDAVTRAYAGDGADFQQS